MTSGEEDFTKRSKSFVDLKFVDGVPIATPTVEACVPTSIENDAIAYDATNDRFKVDIVALTLGILDMNLTQVFPTRRRNLRGSRKTSAESYNKRRACAT